MKRFILTIILIILLAFTVQAQNVALTSNKNEPKPFCANYPLDSSPKTLLYFEASGSTLASEGVTPTWTATSLEGRSQLSRNGLLISGNGNSAIITTITNYQPEYLTWDAGKSDWVNGGLVTAFTELLSGTHTFIGKDDGVEVYPASILQKVEAKENVILGDPGADWKPLWNEIEVTPDGYAITTDDDYVYIEKPNTSLSSYYDKRTKRLQVMINGIAYIYEWNDSLNDFVFINVVE